MAVVETNISKRIQIATSILGARLFRNNRGLFLTLDGLRKVRAGLETDGASDLIGFTPVEITADMVGKTIAVFTTIEVKRPGGSKTKSQKDFVNFVNKQGGLAGFATCESEAVDIINRHSLYDMFR